MPQLRNNQSNTRQYGSELIDKARGEFLHQVQVIAPHVLKDLRDNVLPVYAAEYRAALAARERRSLHNLQPLLAGFVSDRELGRMELFISAKQRWDAIRGRGLETCEWSATLRRLLRSWARTHHLTTDGRPPDWIVRNAESTLLAWAWYEGNGDAPLVWSLTGRYKKEPDQGSIPENNQFDAAVRFQCGGVGVAQLTTKQHNRDLVEEWIQQVLDLVGLGRRSGDTGEPQSTHREMGHPFHERLRKRNSLDSY